MTKISMLAAAIAALFVAQLSSAASAQNSGYSPAQTRAAQAQAAKAQMQARAARSAQAGMANAMVTSATLQATEAGECSPYLARWMQTKSMYWRMQYEACMED